MEYILFVGANVIIINVLLVHWDVSLWIVTGLLHYDARQFTNFAIQSLGDEFMANEGNV